jgi:gamma-glutamylcyclotransferase (GGCT)/AIG2-like uncharacterized protein YtfP
MNNEIFQLFVYGSLRSGFRNTAYQYLSSYFTLIGEGKVKGKLFDKGTYPVAVPDHDDNFIDGELYQLNNPAEFAWAIEQIDDYEGLHVEVGEKPLYKRDVATVYINGEQTKAWIYWYDGSVEGYPELPSGNILDYLQQRNKRG